MFRKRATVSGRRKNRVSSFLGATNEPRDVKRSVDAAGYRARLRNLRSADPPYRVRVVAHHLFLIFPRIKSRTQMQRGDSTSSRVSRTQLLFLEGVDVVSPFSSTSDALSPRPFLHIVPSISPCPCPWLAPLSRDERACARNHPSKESAR